MAAKKRGLGRGLDALLSSAAAASPSAESPVSGADPSVGNASSAQPAESVLREVPIDLIQRGKYQPRRDMDSEALQELANSITAQGVMQPIVIRPVGGEQFEIIAGERRWRAAQLAGLDVIPALVRDVPDDAAIAMALIENIQREDLNPIEEAMALQRLQQEFELTQQEVADAVGKSRSTVTNLLRLMALQPEVRKLLEHGDLDMGHARALLTLDGQEQSQVARTVVARSLSVRQTEALVRHTLAAREREGAPPAKIDPNIRALQDELAQRLGTGVQIQHQASGKGRLVLSYSSLDQLDGILRQIR